MELADKRLPSLDQIEFLCKTIFGMLKIPIYFITEDKKILFQFSNKDFKHPMNKDAHELLLQLLEETSSLCSSYVKSTRYLENFIFLKVISSNGIKGTIIAGPSVSIRITPAGVEQLISDFNIPIKFRADLNSYFRQMTVINYESLSSLAILMHYSLTGEQLQFEDIIKVENTVENKKRTTSFSLENYSLGRLQYSEFHHSKQSEDELLQCISDGDVDALSSFLKKPFDGAPGVHSKNPLRNQKNLFISTVPKISKAAVDGGMDWELALTLSDYYIQCVEELTDIKDILNLLCKMYYDYAYRVNAHKSQAHSKVIAKCIDYIDNHLYEKISLAKLSKYVAMNLCYLSHLFKKETGIPLSEYIQNRRIEEAKKLIIDPQNKLTDIYETLGFHDQSYFTKVFKKVTGLTPKEYRSLHSSKD